VAWLLAFLFTQAIEIPIYMRGLRVRVYEAFGASAFTHPIVWFVIPPLCDWLYFTLMAPHPALRIEEEARYWAMVVVAEMFAIVGEAFYFKWLRKKNTWRWSLAANLTSVTLGMISRELFGVP
jgi:hypothetical protein